MPGGSIAPEIRFVSDGGYLDRIRAALAGPYLVTASRLMRLVAGTGSRRSIRYLERVLGRVAELLAGIRLDVAGLERVDRCESYVVVALHEGFADALALLRLPLPLRFAARDELYGWPALGPYLPAAAHLRVDTVPSVASARRFYREAAGVFDAGESLVIFAQGTVLGLEVAFREGPLRLARRFSRPLLPVVVTGSHRVWEHPYSSIFRPDQAMSVRVLDPVPSRMLTWDAFRALEREMKRIALSDGMAPARRFRPEHDGWWDGYPYEIDDDFPLLQARLTAHRESARP